MSTTTHDRLADALADDEPLEPGEALALLDELGPLLEADGIGVVTASILVASGDILIEGDGNEYDRDRKAIERYVRGQGRTPAPQSVELARRWLIRALPKEAREATRAFVTCQLAVVPQYGARMRIDIRPVSEYEPVVSNLTAPAIDQLTTAGVATARCPYNAFEDSGCWMPQTAFASDGTAIPVAPGGPLEELLEEVCFEAIRHDDGEGYYSNTNQGCQGVVLVDVKAGTATRTHLDGHYGTHEYDDDKTPVHAIGPFPKDIDWNLW